MGNIRCGGMNMKNNAKFEAFYLKFKQSELYFVLMIVIVFLGGLFFSFGDFVFKYIPYGPFVFGPYIMLILMLIVFTLYKNIFLYLFVITLFIINSLLSFVGIAMGSTIYYDIILYFIPVIIFLIINIRVAIVTYKYK